MPIPRSVLSRDGVPDLDLELTSGVWPEDLTGEIFLSTADQATAPKHAFFGDGVMARLSLRPGTHGAPADRLAWRANVIDTPSRRLREKRPHLFDATALGTTSPFGHVNAANTAPLPWGERLFATWDAGRPVEIDPVTLGFVAEVGHRDDWAPAFDHPVMPLIASTAHPVIDPDRHCLWTVSLNPMLGQVQIIRYDGDSSRVQRWPVRDGVIPQSMHTIAQTRDWLILVDTAFRADPNEILELGPRTIAAFPDEPVYLVRKAALEETPSGTEVDAVAFRVAPEVMHYYAVYDDLGGIRLIFEHTPGTDLAYYVQEGDTDALGRPVDPALAGMYNHPMAPARLSLLDFEPTSGKVIERATMVDADRYWATQLSALDWSTEGMSAPTVHHQLFTGYRPEAIVSRALAAYKGRVDPHELPTEEIPGVLATFDRAALKNHGDHAFALDDYPTSPTFVPRDPAALTGSATTAPGTAGPGRHDDGRSRYAGSDPGGHDGYLVVPVLHDDGFRVEVFDAADVAAGPLATVSSPDGETVPFLIHSAWMPRAVPAPTDVERLHFADELDESKLAALTDDQRTAVREVAAEL